MTVTVTGVYRRHDVLTAGLGLPSLSNVRTDYLRPIGW